MKRKEEKNQREKRREKRIEKEMFFSTFKEIKMNFFPLVAVIFLWKEEINKKIIFSPLKKTNLLSVLKKGLIFSTGKKRKIQI